MKSFAALLFTLGFTLMLGLAGPGQAQNLCPQQPTGTFCVTTPLAASGNSSCVVNMCFTYDLGTVPRQVHISSIQPVTGSDCSHIVSDLSAPSPEQALMEAAEKEAIKITVERCERCFPAGTRIYQSVTPVCFHYSATNHTWSPCPSIPPETRCISTYSVTCSPSDPYTWTWGPPGGTVEPDWGSCGSDPQGKECARTCAW
jgi:hypothetical protein